MTEKLQLSKSDRQKFGGVQPSCKGSWNYEQCKTWVGHSPSYQKTLHKEEDQAWLLLNVTWNSFNTHPYVAAQSSG